MSSHNIGFNRAVGNTFIDDTYDEIGRFASYWHQINELRPYRAGRLLEVGLGTGFASAYMRRLGFCIQTIDVNPDLRPDVVGSVLDLPFAKRAFDAVACCQVLEHLPYECFAQAVSELRRVTDRAAVLSLPDLGRRYGVSVRIPLLGALKTILELPRLRAPRWEFNGEHHWNIGVKGYPLRRVVEDIRRAGFSIERTFCVNEYTWHRFFVLRT